MKTYEAVVEQVRILAQENPQFIYTDQPGRKPSMRCSYLGANRDAEGGVGCIVGQALERVGVTREELREVEGMGALSAVQRILGDDQPDSRNAENSQRLWWLSVVQAMQDQGSTWEDAVRSADREALPYPHTNN